MGRASRTPRGSPGAIWTELRAPQGGYAAAAAKPVWIPLQRSQSYYSTPYPLELNVSVVADQLTLSSSHARARMFCYGIFTHPLSTDYERPAYIWGSGGMSWDAKGVLEAKVSRDTRCPGQSPSWDGVGCPRTPRFVPGHLRCPRTVLSQDGQLSWDGRRRSRTALLGHQVSRDTTCPWTFFSAPERPPLTPDGGYGSSGTTKGPVPHTAPAGHFIGWQHLQVVRPSRARELRVCRLSWLQL